MIPTYRSMVRDTVKVGDIITTEVPGLAEALRRPGIETAVEVTLGEIVPILRRELGAGGDALGVITRGVSNEEATRRRTRIRALLAAVTGAGA